MSRGANATVAGNTVSGNVYTGSHADPDDFASGIMFFISNGYLGQGGITIGANMVTANEYGIWTNDSRTLTTTSLTGVSGNARNAVAYFNGGYANENSLLKYPAWSAANAALVNSGAFSGAQTGDILDLGGALRVTGWSGFTAIQPAIDAVAAGGTVNVAAGTFAEHVVLNQQRNLLFSGSTIQGLTINAGAAGSGIGGSVTANTAAGFMFNAPVVLLGDAALSTTGANIVLNDVQSAAGTSYSLSLMAGAGDITLASGGMPGNPLGQLDATSNDFTLSGTLWVTGFNLNASGSIALGDHSLHGTRPDGFNTIRAGANADGTAVSASRLGVDAGGYVHMTIDAPSGSYVRAGGDVDINHIGSGLIEINGRLELPAALSDNVESNRMVPPEITISSNSAGSAAGPVASGPVVDSFSPLAPALAGEVLDQGRPVELDLTPGNERRR